MIFWGKIPLAIVSLLKNHFLLCDPFTNGPFFFSLRRCELEPHLQGWYPTLQKGHEIVCPYIMSLACVW